MSKSHQKFCFITKSLETYLWFQKRLKQQHFSYVITQRSSVVLRRCRSHGVSTMLDLGSGLDLSRLKFRRLGVPAPLCTTKGDLVRLLPRTFSSHNRTCQNNYNNTVSDFLSHPHLMSVRPSYAPSHRYSVFFVVLSLQSCGVQISQPGQ
jgi:hypothetical protein